MGATAIPEVSDLVEASFDDLFEVVVFDDDRTTFDTVISALISVCGHSHAAASRLAWHVHTEGSAVVAADSLSRAEALVVGLLAHGVRASLRQV